MYDGGVLRVFDDAFMDARGIAFQEPAVRYLDLDPAVYFSIGRSAEVEESMEVDRDAATAGWYALLYLCH